MKIWENAQLCSSDSTAYSNLDLNKVTNKDFLLGAGQRSGAAALCES